MATFKEEKFPDGTVVSYKLPNVVEQLRFHRDSKWFDPDFKIDLWERSIYAFDYIKPFIVSIEGTRSLEDLFEDRDNMDAFLRIVWDIAGGKLGEETKKP